MSLVLADRVRETTQTTGTGTITLDGAVQGFQSFSVIGNNNTTYYTINRGSEWEVGIGTYYGGTLSRDTVYASSNGGSKVNFSAGSKDVFVTYPASKSVNEDANNRVLIPYTTGTTNVGSLNVGDATAHTDSGVIAGFTASEPLYLYTSLQNTSTANTSYASYAVNDGGHTAYGELGINNSNYSYSAAGFPNNGFSTPLATFVESYGGPLVLGSWDSQKISFIVNGAVNTSDAMTVETSGAVTIPSIAATGGTINGTPIGGTTPSTGTFTTLIGGGGSANYGQLTGGATTKAVEFQTLGSDSNIALVLDTKGTGAIDLASGSSGVNISNGGTVTAITRTAAGSAYTAFPNITISAPTTASGVQATASVALMIANAATIQSGGTGYTLNDVVTLSGGTPSVAATFTVTGVTGGVVTSVSSTNFGTYSVLPSNPVSVTGGTGTGLTLNVTWAVGTSFTITNAGSGYVEQPTITFTPVSGGSGATAYATVGSIPTIRTLASAISFATPSSEVFRIVDANPTAQNYVSLESSGSGVVFRSAGASATGTIAFVTKSTGTINFCTNTSSTNVQMSVSNTASAVNYVQVTGATTASKVVAISAQGSDTDVTLSLSPKGAGTIRFGTYTAGVLTPTGYITITDSGGTSRRLLVG